MQACMVSTKSNLDLCSIEKFHHQDLINWMFQFQEDKKKRILKLKMKVKTSESQDHTKKTDTNQDSIQLLLDYTMDPLSNNLPIT